MQLIEYIFEIKSDRQLCKEIQLNIAYRWFCKLGINDPVPEHSSLTKIRDRFGVKVYKIIFEALIKKWAKIGIIAGKVMISDASLINSKCVFR
jgi:transposase